MPRSVSNVIVIADDLSGAAESAMALASGTRVLLTANRSLEGDEHLVIDVGSRALSAEAAATTTARAVRRAVAARRYAVIKKVDSLLRGHILQEIRAIRATGLPVILSPALPTHGRVVRNGRPFVDGMPLSSTPAWHNETSSPPTHLGKHFADLDAVILSTDDIAGDRGARLLADRVTAGRLPVIDAESDADLAVVWAAARLAFPEQPFILAGSSALVRQASAHLPAPKPFESRAQRVLVVAGSAEPIVREQVAALRASGGREIRVSVASLLDGATDVAELARLIGDDAHTVVLTLAAPDFRPDAAQRTAAAFASLVAELLSTVPHRDTWAVALIGGQTARAVLDELGIDEITVLQETAHGTVIARAEALLIGLRPGSFGTPDDLIRLSTALRTSERQST